MDALLNLPLLLAGASLCAVVTGGAVWSLTDHLQRRRARRRRIEASRTAFRKQVEAVAADARARVDNRLAWEGLRDFCVVAINEECRDVKSFYLAAADGRPLAPYHPGQYLTIHLPQKQAAAKPVVRCYSLSDRPREEFYRLTVKRCWPPASSPEAMPGVGSTILHTQVAVGDVLKAAAPRGDFFLPVAGDEPVVLIGGGIGVTPLLSMALAGAHAGSTRETHLVLGMRDSSEFPLRREVEELAAKSPNLHLSVAYSRPSHRDKPRDFDHHGRVTQEHLQRVLPDREFRYYLCGPGAMLESLVPELLDSGVPSERIHFEAFGPASIDRSKTSRAAKAAVGKMVRFARSGVQAPWTADDKTVLELAERLGVPMDAGCRVGNCGACATRVVEGRVTHVKDPGVGAGEGACLACVSVPADNLVLEA